MGRSPCCSKVGLNRGAWTVAEDKILRDYININGEGKWRNLPQEAGLKRCGKSCRLRWLNYLRPDIKRGNISPDEEELIIRLHKLLGNRWSLIAGRLPGRTDNEIKNYWNTTLAKKIHNQHGPVSSTHKKSNVQSIKKKKSTSEIDQSVVRTKAKKCTKAYFSPQQDKTQPIEPNNNVKECVSNVDANASKQSSNDGTLPSTPSKDDVSNSTLDVNLEEDFSLDLLESDILDLLNYNDLGDFSPSSNVPPISYEEVLEDWDFGDYIQQNVAANHDYFDSSKLQVDWLA